MSSNTRPFEFTPRRIAFVVLGLGLSALFAWLTFRRVPIGDVLEASSEVAVVWLLGSQVTKLGGFFATTGRSLLLTKHLHRFSFLQMFRSMLVAFVGNVALPFRAGELLRAGYLARKSDRDPVAYVGIIGFEKLLDSLFLLVVFLLVVPNFVGDVSESQSIPLIASGLIGAVALVLGVSRFPEHFMRFVAWITAPFGERISGFIVARADAFTEGIQGVASTRLLLGATLYTAAYWTMSGTGVWMWIQAFGFDVPWYTPLLVLSLTAFGTALPASPGFVGTYHYFSSLGMQLVGVGATAAASFALVGHAMAMVPAAIFGIIFLAPEWLRLFRRSPTPQRAEEDVEATGD